MHHAPLHRRALMGAGLSALSLGTVLEAKALNPRPKAADPFPLIIGHRGAPGHAPEHTRLSYETAMAMGADYIEPDLVATKDGHLVVRHDPVLSDSTDIDAHPEFANRKTTRAFGSVEVTDFFVADFTLAELKTLRCRQVMAGRDHKNDGLYEILSLEEVIDLLKSGQKRWGRTIGLYPELKASTYHHRRGLALEPRLLDTLRRAGLHHRHSPVIIQSFETENLKRLKSQTPLRLMQLVDGTDVDPVSGEMILKAPDDKPYDWFVAQKPGTYQDLLTPKGLAEVATYAQIIAPWKRYLIRFQQDPQSGAHRPIMNKALVTQAHGLGLQVHTWTLRNDAAYLDSFYQGDPLKEYAHLFELGVDGVFSDFPDTAIKARQIYLQSRAAKA